MKLVLLVIVCLTSYLQTCSSKTLNDEATYREYEKYLLWGHALANSKHNLILGQKQPNDWLLNQKVISKSGSWIPFVKETDKYNFSIPRPGYLTYVEVLDQATNGKGGYATLISGGPGYRNISLSFTSQRNQGLNFIVSVYGKPNY